MPRSVSPQGPDAPLSIRAYFDMYFSDRPGDERTEQRQSLEGFPSGQWEQAVNLPAFAFVGSNPTPSTGPCGQEYRWPNAECQTSSEKNAD